MRKKRKTFKLSPLFFRIQDSLVIAKTKGF